MTQQEFELVMGRLPQFRQSSFLGKCFEDVKDYTLTEFSTNCIIAFGYNNEVQKNACHWATNDKFSLLERIREKKSLFISAIPQEWVERFMENGYTPCPDSQNASDEKIGIDMES